MLGDPSRRPYAFVAAALFAVLVAIEAWLDDGFIRYTVGDAVVTSLLYTVLMAATQWSPIRAAAVALGIACAIEMTQALDVVTRLGIEPNRLTDAVLGTTFSWSDIVAYALGVGLAILVESAR